MKMNCTVYDLVPKHKSDSSHIKDLERLSDDEIRPVLFPLLEWIQDINWPVAADVLPILAKHSKDVVPLIIEVLSPEEKDDIWKFWIIKELLPLFPYSELTGIIPCLERIVSEPAKGEIAEEVNIQADIFLKTAAQKKNRPSAPQ